MENKMENNSAEQEPASLKKWIVENKWKVMLVVFILGLIVLVILWSMYQWKFVALLASGIAIFVSLRCYWHEHKKSGSADIKYHVEKIARVRKVKDAKGVEADVKEDVLIRVNTETGEAEELVTGKGWVSVTK